MTPEETFYDEPSPEHPVRWSPSTGTPAKWLSLNDAVHRLERVLSIPPHERRHYRFADRLQAGEMIVTLFADYMIPKEG